MTNTSQLKRRMLDQIVNSQQVSVAEQTELQHKIKARQREDEIERRAGRYTPFVTAIIFALMIMAVKFLLLN